MLNREKGACASGRDPAGFVAQWEGVSLASGVDWFYDVGQDRHSFQAAPGSWGFALDV